MVKRSKGIRSKSRKILRKKPRERGIKSITRALQEFEEGETVSIVIDPAVHKGMPHVRFQGRTGKIEGKQGEAYLVGINDGKKHKTLIVRSEHLRRV
ncbi:MAG: 50S ribosomal protein L21e [Thermoplasmata archaeon]|nr:MAG: 50S ribosomal protein L21e [Thermoplasmata archaeon]RLF36803.1 MAG: 50S ribosomal protein L21e [Thermoplasmata archaeon]RLF51006.1 MAG: 50S ribosomal protein L21e [Thermoplasmata archaeon]